MVPSPNDKFDRQTNKQTKLTLNPMRNIPTHGVVARKLLIPANEGGDTVSQNQFYAPSGKQP